LEEEEVGGKVSTEVKTAASSKVTEKQVDVWFAFNVYFSNIFLF